MIDEPTETPPDDDRRRVEEALRRVESAVRQRHALLATRTGEREAVQTQLLELKETELLREAVAISSRPVLGPLLVWFRRAVHHLFGKWQIRPILQQQSRFNQAATRLLEESLETQQRMARELERLRVRVESWPAGAAAEPDETHSSQSV